MKKKAMKIILGVALAIAAGTVVAQDVVCTGCHSDGNGGWVCVECHAA